MHTDMDSDSKYKKVQTEIPSRNAFSFGLKLPRNPKYIHPHWDWEGDCSLCLLFLPYKGMPPGTKKNHVFKKSD